MKLLHLRHEKGMEAVANSAGVGPSRGNTLLIRETVFAEARALGSFLRDSGILKRNGCNSKIEIARL